MIYKIPSSYYRFLVFFIKKQPIGFILLLLISLASAASTTIWPYVMSNVIDVINDYQGDKTLIFHKESKVFIGALLFWISVECIMRMKGIILATFLPRFEANIRMSTYRYISQHSHSYFVSNYIGAIANRIADLPRSSSLVLDIMTTQFLAMLLAILLSAVLLFQINYILTFALVGWLTCHLGLCFYFFKKASNYSKIQSEARSLIQGKIVDNISNHLSVRLFDRHHYEHNHLTQTQEEERQKYRFALMYIEKIKLALGLLSMISVNSIFYITIILWRTEEITIGNVVFIANLTLNMMSLVWIVGDEMTYFFRESGICSQALKIIQDQVLMTEKLNAHDLIINKGSIEFDEVTFYYQKRSILFRNLSVKIHGGQKIGLVGKSGSGKTTFANLILRLYDVNAGSITIDNQDIRSITHQSLRSSISLIPQDPVMFHRSIIENVRYGKIEATDEEVMDACKKAQCHDFIMEMPDGYQTIVGERGASLSGGQRQRLSIARAILANTAIVIMDEATSGMDNVTESKIRQAIDYLTKDRTVIIIAHRLSTLKNVDRILVFDDGKIIEDGTHEDLIRQNGLYRVLWSSGKNQDVIDD